MSEEEFCVGKLIPLEFIGFTLDESLEKLANDNEWEVEDNDFMEAFEENGYREYIIIKDKIYKVIYDNKDSYDSFFQATKNNDGSISFILKFYNGGCSFSEAIEEAMKKNNIFN